MIVWLASYPRSGNTFFRVVLNNVFGIKTYSIYNDSNDIGADKKTSEVVGHEFLPADFDLENARKSSKTYYIKTHELFNKVDLKDGDKVIYLVRDGRESSLSFAHYLKDFNGKEKNVLKDILYGCMPYGSWGDHVGSWMDADKFMVKFEELIDDPIGTAKKIGVYLDIKMVSEDVPTFEQLHNVNPKFFRSGKKKSWKSEFSELDNLIFWADSFDEMIALDYFNDMPIGLTESLDSNILKNYKFIFESAKYKHKKINELELKLINFTNQKNQELQEKDQKIAQKNQELQEKDQKIAQKNQELQEKDQKIAQKNQELQEKGKIINQKDDIIEQNDHLVSQKNNIIFNLQNSKSFLVGSLFFRSVKKPYKLITFPINFLRILLAIPFLKYKNNVIKKFKSFKKRKINLSSKKLVYIGHSYHNKTKSTDFLINYLRKFFDVEIILDESWSGEPYPDLSFIDESYVGVVFFQLLPPKDILDNINNDNLIYFPMYDQFKSSGLGYEYWHNYKKLKIMNFSKNAHFDFKKWGFDSMYAQYFPKPQEFVAGNKNEVFFWQRLTSIHINLVEKVLGLKDFKIHLHKSVDPRQKFIKPTEEQEKKYKITYSEWFDTREEMQNLIKEKAIYVAPRELEGIGMSFLEAMSMGKAVIAANNPTMNEYIIHGENGYLFDLKNPKEIDLSNIDEVQKNVYNYMQRGFKTWNQDKKKIIDFIKKA